MYAGGMETQKFILDRLRQGESRQKIEFFLVMHRGFNFKQARAVLEEATQTLVDSCMDTTHQQFKAQLIEQVQATHAAAIEDRNHRAAIAAANFLAKLGELV